MPDLIQVMTTTDTREAAQQIAEQLVNARLAACVQIVGPIESTYWWEGRVERAEEWLCLVKTRATRFAEVEQVIRPLHPYDVPEIIALPAVDAGVPYLHWLHETVPERSTSSEL